MIQRKIVSYFGNLYLHHFEADIQEIKAHGFNVIVLCVPEAYMTWNLDNVKAMKEYAEDQGLEVWADPWGLGNMFGGEALSSVNYETNYEKAIDLFKHWIECMGRIGIKDIFLDEPKCYINIRQYLEHFKFHLCLTDNSFDKISDIEIMEMGKYFETVSLSCYFWNYDAVKVSDRIDRWIPRLKMLCPDNSCIWIQGFNLPEGKEWITLAVYDFAKTFDIPHIGFWGYRSTEAISSIRAVNYKDVWNGIGKILNEK